jgi:hypothetical protein
VLFTLLNRLGLLRVAVATEVTGLDAAECGEPAIVVFSDRQRVSEQGHPAVIGLCAEFLVSMFALHVAGSSVAHRCCKQCAVQPCVPTCSLCVHRTSLPPGFSRARDTRPALGEERPPAGASSRPSQLGHEIWRWQQRGLVHLDLVVLCMAVPSSSSRPKA